MSTREHANNPSHYILLTVAIIIGIVGVYLRFAGEGGFLSFWSMLSNIILLVAIVIALKAVFTIMK